MEKRFCRVELELLPEMSVLGGAALNIHDRMQ